MLLARPLIFGVGFLCWALSSDFWTICLNIFLSRTVIKFCNCKLYAVLFYVLPKCLYIIKSYIEHFFHTEEEQVLGGENVGHNFIVDDFIEHGDGEHRLWSQTAGFKSQLYHILALRPWVSYILCLSFLIYKKWGSKRIW